MTSLDYTTYYEVLPVLHPEGSGLVLGFLYDTIIADGPFGPGHPFVHQDKPENVGYPVS